MILNTVITQPLPPKIRATGSGTIGSAISPRYIMKKAGIESRCKFFVIEKQTGRIIYRGISNADGSWEVTGLNPDKYFQVINYDENGIFNSSSADWLQPVVI